MEQQLLNDEFSKYTKEGPGGRRIRRVLFDRSQSKHFKIEVMKSREIMYKCQGIQIRCLKIFAWAWKNELSVVIINKTFIGATGAKP